MSLVNAIFSTFLEAIFPTTPAEREVLGMDASKAWLMLPRAKQFPILEACSIFAYKDERVWRLIWAIKYKKSKLGAAIAGYALHRILQIYASVAPSMIVVPMPITKKRRRERGYNQCELVLDAIEKLDTEHRLVFVRDLLIRVRHTSRQTLKDRAERIESAEDIFAVDLEALERMKVLATNGSGAKDPLVIVIDDVVTTGSTMRDAVQTLRRAGFTNTFGISVAH